MHKKLAKRICALAVAAMMAVFWGSSAFAASHIVDFSKTGNLTITLRDTETQQSVPEGTFALYLIGNLGDKGYNIYYEKTPDFMGFKEDISDINTPAMAQSLAAYLSSGEIGAYMIADTDATGTVSFSELPLGLYLVVYSSPEGAYHSVDPFLVSIPIADPVTGYWLYDINANPKLSAESPSPSPTPAPSSPPSPSGKLPQTGMLMWPIPVLTGIGLLLFLFGWVLNKRESDET